MHIIIHGFHDHGWKNGEHVYSGDDILAAHRAVAARAGEFQKFGRIYAPQFIPFTPQAASALPNLGAAVGGASVPPGQSPEPKKKSKSLV